MIFAILYLSTIFLPFSSSLHSSSATNSIEVIYEYGLKGWQITDAHTHLICAVTILIAFSSANSELSCCKFVNYFTFINIFRELWHFSSRSWAHNNRTHTHTHIYTHTPEYCVPTILYQIPFIHWHTINHSLNQFASILFRTFWRLLTHSNMTNACENATPQRI